MRKNTIWRSTFREIRRSFGRFAAILAIVALGVGFFAGLKVTRSAMVKTTGQYLEETDFFDYRLLSTLGFEQEDVDFFSGQDGVRAAEGSITCDILYRMADGGGGVVKAHSLTGSVNRVKLLAGRMPAEPWECVADANLFEESALGEVLLLAEENAQEDLENFAYGEYTIVGIVQSPYYLQYERGNSSLGSGRVNGYVYLEPAGFALDYYTEIFVKFDRDFEMYTDAYENYLEGKETVWKELTAQAGERRYLSVQADAQKELADARQELAEEKEDAQAELDDAKKELDDAQRQLGDARQELADGEKEIADGEKELADAYKTLAEKETELADAGKEIADAQAELEKGEKELQDGMDEWKSQSDAVDDAKAQIESAQKELAVQGAALDEQERQLQAGESALFQQEALLNAAYGAGMISLEEYTASMAGITAGKEQIEAGKAAIIAGRQTIAAYVAQLAAGMEQAASGDSALAKAYMELQEAQAELEDGKKELEDAKEQFLDGERQLADGKQELADAKKELAEAKKELADGRKEYEDGVRKYEDGLLEYKDGLGEFETKIADAQTEIADAQEELAELKKPDTYVLDRDTNVGYVCFESDSSIVDGIANIFPIFFFLVAALVCSTTMNRMVEEQRTQIGVLKALGYGNGVVMSKYLFYAGTAGFTGCVAGFFGGTWIFPRVIWTAYGMMYRVDSLLYVFDWRLAVISMAAALLCTMGATWLSCRYELSQVSAELMRPKAPKAGKRVLLEFIPFVWHRLSFLKKVSMRNIFRYKKRLFMMVIGISGCTALLVTGFGVKDSIAHVGDQQFEEIQIYDCAVTFSEEVTEEMEEELRQAAGAGVEGYYLLMERTMNLVNEQGTKSVNLVVADEKQDITPYLNLHTEKKEPLDYPGEGEAVITGKLARELGIHAGENVNLQDDEGNVLTLKVSGISRNFIYNYVYISEKSYEEHMGEMPERKTAWVNIAMGEEVHRVSAALMQVDSVSNVTVNQDTMERFGSMMRSLDMIVVVIIICAGGLAFIVLYNLTNINITERVREIATIKVLGFYKNETATYVFRENTLLTLLGAVVGLPLGCLFHRFVMSQVKIDMVSFDTLVLPLSYLYSALLTMAFAWMINRFMRRKLERISMTESLKSVD